MTTLCNRYLEVKLFKVADALTLEVVDIGALAPLTVVVGQLGLGRVPRHVHPKVRDILARVHAEAVQLIVAHVEAGLAGGRFAQLASLLRIFGGDASFLEAVARVLGALQCADGHIDDEADVALVALVAVAVAVCHPAPLTPRLPQVLQRVLKSSAQFVIAK